MRCEDLHPVVHLARASRSPMVSSICASSSQLRRHYRQHRDRLSDFLLTTPRGLVVISAEAVAECVESIADAIDRPLAF